MMSDKSLYAVIAAFIFLLLSQFGAAAPSVTPGVDTHNTQLINQKLITINQRLDVLTLAMGKEVLPRSPISGVVGGTPLELESLARAMYEKINTLQGQLLRQSDLISRKSYEQHIIDRKAEYDVANIIRLLTVSESIADKIAARYKLFDEPPTRSCMAAQSCDRGYGEIMVDMLNINRKINHLLLQPYDSSAVYQQIAKATSYWILLMHHKYPIQSAIPRADEFVANKRSVDVFQRLLRLNESLNQLIKYESGQVLPFSLSAEFAGDSPSDGELTKTGLVGANITPGDVYDLSSIILGRVLYFVARQTDITEAINYPYPGVKFPSHVYRFVSRLENGVMRMNTLLATPQAQFETLSAKLSESLLQHTH